MRAPLQLFIETTKKCNQNCCHCFADATGQPGSELAKEEMQEIISQAAVLGVMEAHLSGGEPLLRPDIFEIVAWAARYEWMDVTLLTNGTLILGNNLLGRIVELFTKNKNLRLQVSLDGFDPGTYNLTRRDRAESFYNVCEAILQLVGAGVKTDCVFAAGNHNCAHALKTAYFALNDLGVDRFLIVPVFLTGRARKHRLEPDFAGKAWHDLIFEATQIKKGHSWGKLSGCFNIGFFTFYEIFLPLKSMGLEEDAYSVWGFPRNFNEIKLYQGDFCHAARSELVVASDGYVYPCIPAINLPEFRSGNIRDQSLESIWIDSEMLNWFRNGRVQNVPEGCSACDYLKMCGGGCRVASVALTGNVTGNDLRCPLLCMREPG